MTPQLQQAIKLLQYSNVELAAYLEGELEQNPLLERADGDGALTEERGEEESAGLDEAAAPAAESNEGAGDSFDKLEDQAQGSLANSGDAPLDTTFENLFNHDGPSETPLSLYQDGPSAPGVGGSDLGRNNSFLDQTLSQSTTLRQHLMEQLQISLSDPSARLIGVHLIDMLDGAGYLEGDLQRVAAVLGCQVQQVEATLETLQGFDPIGVFARSLRECLALQLAERNRLDPAMETLLDNLPLVARGEAAALTRLCGVDNEDLAEMLGEIRALNPKPAESFDSPPAEVVIPDILLHPRGDEGWVIELNSEVLPRVLINESYYATVSARTHLKSDRDYLSARKQSANWLVKALQQRATTILKVAHEIVRQQDAFFRKGIRYLKPLTLNDIAEAIEMHESTVSRATSNKFMITPRGTFELKFFFTAAIAGTDGALHSAAAIRHRIKVLIAAEALNNVLSDDSIVDALRGDGIQIARRTVAKYREAMRIPSSVQRRRAKAVSL